MAAVFIGLAGLAAFAGLGVLTWRYVREREETRSLRELFSRYVPEHVLEEILARRDRRPLWAARHYATVLSCRIANFDLFAEELSAEDTLRHLNEFYAVAGRAIVRHGGVIERLHADGITAVFGVLTDDAFQEDRALRAALRIARLANAMDRRWRELGRKPFRVSIGVNSGNVVAGEVGFAQRREFAVVGNPAHVAARLAHAAEQLNAAIVASDSAYTPVADAFVAVAVTKLPLAGLKKLQKAYIIRGLARRNEEELLHLPPAIAALETVIAPEEPRPRFSEFDDIVAAMPAVPAVSGVYEDPQESAAMPLPPLPALRHPDGVRETAPE